MSAQTLLEQLLKSGLSMIQSGNPAGAALPAAPSGMPPARPAGGAGPSPGPGSGPSASEGFAWGTFGAGAASGGALAMLLGHKRGRGLAGKALKVGSVAAIGALAYKAYGAWQAQQRATAAGVASPPATAAAPKAAVALGGPASWSAASTAPARMADQVVGAELEQHSRAMLLAMVAAAKADGHLDERERSLVEDELHRLEADAAVRGWIDAELRRPLDPAAVAREATSPELAAEMYLASLLVADDTNRMERLYLDEIAREMRLPDGLKSQLEAQARSVAAG